ncbi:interleukin-13 [Myxocyprinus asiaticus]|uniref:interleukin-13 n=1 Tax=Myxocyprinus asiaticus TaxID=70543 RepID=UPI00222266D2|nr:interleukin-13 [Myxocyprinus asiaticus]
MMKTLLLACAAVCAFAAPSKTDEKRLLEELSVEINSTLKDLNHKDDIFVTDLKVKNQQCKDDFFCQFEQVLKEEVSGLSGVIFEHFRTNKKLMRNLDKFNRYHEKTCKPVHIKKHEEILLRDFMNVLKGCVQKRYREM